MIKRVLMAVAAGSLLMGLAVTPSAEALPVAKVQAAPGSGVVTDAGMRGFGFHPGMHGMHGPGGGGLRFYGGGGGPRHFHGGHRFFYAAPFVGYGAYYYGGYGGYGSGCGWLRRRAEATGSRYWWARYEDCLDEY